VAEPSGAAKTCPSTTCAEGAVLLGVMTTGGRLAYVHPPTRIDAAFVERERAIGHPERRYRFAGVCVAGGCPQWTGDGCAIADMAADTPHADDATLPACSVRHSCRWYFQRGSDACHTCPLLVADMGGTETYRSRMA
jgi:hypothetical protein